MAWYDLIGCYGTIKNLEKIPWFIINRDNKIKNKDTLRLIWLKVKKKLFIFLFYLFSYKNERLVECGWCKSPWNTIRVR